MVSQREPRSGSEGICVGTGLGHVCVSCSSRVSVLSPLSNKGCALDRYPFQHAVRFTCVHILGEAVVQIASALI